MISGTLVYTGPADAMPAVEAAAAGTFDVLRVEAEPAALAESLARATALLDASMKVRIDAAMIAAAPLLRVVTTATTGADHIDTAALAARGIPLFTLAGQSDVLAKLSAAAEHSWLLLMSCARQLRAAVDHVNAGGWNRVEFPGLMLRGRTLGLVGCGRIGQCMARYAQAFDMRVLGYDPHVDPWPSSITRASFDEVLRGSDFLSVHVPLQASTRQLLSRERLTATKPGVIVINTSRGDVIDETALLDLLRAGHIRGAGLDVLSGEPDVEAHPLRVYAREHPEVVITPHIGGFSPDAVRIAVAHAVSRAVRHVAGRG